MKPAHRRSEVQRLNCGLDRNGVRAPEALPASADDEVIIEHARRHERVIVTQDLDFSALVAISGAAGPSTLSLRLASSRIERVNEVPQLRRRALRDSAPGGRAPPQRAGEPALSDVEGSRST